MRLHWRLRHCNSKQACASVAAASRASPTVGRSLQGPAAAAVFSDHEAADGLQAADTEEMVQARRLLARLTLYAPRDSSGGILADGPASLARVAPYRRRQFDVAVLHGRQLLDGMSLRQLAGVACSLAAAQHSDAAFLASLARAAAMRLRDQVAPAEWGPVCHLATAFARLGFVDTDLMAALAAAGERHKGAAHLRAARCSGPSCMHSRRRCNQRKCLPQWSLPHAVYLYAGTLLLERGAVKFSTQRRASQLAGLLSAFAALRLRAPRLLSAATDAAKHQQAPSVTALLGPWESVLLVWAVGRLAPGQRGALGPPSQQQGVDPVLWTLLQDRATTLVSPACWRPGFLCVYARVHVCVCLCG